MYVDPLRENPDVDEGSRRDGTRPTPTRRVESVVRRVYVLAILIAFLDTCSAFRDVPLRQASKLRKLELGQRSSPHKHSQTFFYVQIKDTCYTAFIKMNVLYFFYLILLIVL